MRRHEILLPINHNYNKFCDILGFFKSKLKKFGDFFVGSEKNHLSARVRWRVLYNYLGLTCTASYYTVLLVLKSGQLLAYQIWEIFDSYD